jgi:hypothetical protein
MSTSFIPEIFYISTGYDRTSISELDGMQSILAIKVFGISFCKIVDDSFGVITALA